MLQTHLLPLIESLNKILAATQFPQLLQTTLKESPTQAMATLFTYYIDGRVLDNLISSLFDQYQESGVVPYNKLLQVLHEEGVDEDELPRVLQLVSLDENEDADFTEFKQLSNVIFNEALSVITYAYIIRGNKDGLHARVDLETVENGIFKIFHRLHDLYPEPRCEDLEFLFEQSDKDKDCYLNLQEFHYLLSVFLRYYRAGIQNNKYADIIFHDNVFANLWVPEKSSEPTGETIDGVTEPVTESDVTIRDEPSSETAPIETPPSSETVTESDYLTERIYPTYEPPSSEDETEPRYVTEGSYPTYAPPEFTESTPIGTEDDVVYDSVETESDTIDGVTEQDYYTEPSYEPEVTESTPSSEILTESDDVTDGLTEATPSFEPQTIDEVTELDDNSEPSSGSLTESDVTIQDEPSSETVPIQSPPSETATESDYATERSNPSYTPPSETEETEPHYVTEGTYPTYAQPSSETEGIESTPTATEASEAHDAFGFFSDYPPTEETQATESTPAETENDDSASEPAQNDSDVEDTESADNGSEPTQNDNDGEDTESDESDDVGSEPAQTDSGDDATEETDATEDTEPIDQNLLK